MVNVRAVRDIPEVVFNEYRYVQTYSLAIDRARALLGSIARPRAQENTREISMMRGEKEERVEGGTGDGGDGGLYSVVSLPVLSRTYPSYPRLPTPTFAPPFHRLSPI